MQALKRSTVISILLVVALILLVVLVWPTFYRYDHMRLGTYDYPVKIKGLTGNAEVLYPSGWQAPGEQSRVASKLQELPTEEKAKLQGEPQITSYGWMEFHVYNGSAWNVSEVTVLVKVFNADKTERISRSYRMKGLVTPQSSSKFLADLGFTLNANQTWSYLITSAEGTPMH